MLEIHAHIPRTDCTYISLSSVGVPFLPRSLPLIPLRNVYCLMLGTSRFVTIYPSMATIKYAKSCEATGGGMSFCRSSLFCCIWLMIHRWITIAGFPMSLTRRAPGGSKGKKANITLSNRRDIFFLWCFGLVRRGDAFIRDRKRADGKRKYKKQGKSVIWPEGRNTIVEK